ncbi:MAG: hypothetical protein PHX74_06635 [Candidatus Sumerlaeales bacterium]|nr:hypothetical protein [Candidatus Sumerlaeales bacterium]
MKTSYIVGIAVLVVLGFVGWSVFFDKGEPAAIGTNSLQKKEGKNFIGKKIENTEAFAADVNKNLEINDFVTSNTPEQMKSDLRILPFALVQALCLNMTPIEKLKAEGKVSYGANMKLRMEFYQKVSPAAPYTKLDIYASQAKLYSLKSISGYNQIMLALSKELTEAERTESTDGQDYFVEYVLDLKGDGDPVQMSCYYAYFKGVFRRVNESIGSVAGYKYKQPTVSTLQLDGVPAGKSRKQQQGVGASPQR